MLQISNLKLSYNDQFIFEIESLVIENNQAVIGLIGDNGVGKSSLMRIISGQENNYQGLVKNNFTTTYIEQNYFQPNTINVSGGEYSKKQIINAFNQNCELLILDEPSVHLDQDNRQFLLKAIKNFKGVIILVTHDREMIQQTATTILEIEDNKINKFNMNYDSYLYEKENMEKQKELDFFKYSKEKKQIEKNLNMRRRNSQNTDRKPKRMSASDAKLINSFNYQGKKSVDKNIKALKTKLEKLEEAPHLYEFKKKVDFNFDISDFNKKILYIESHNLEIQRGDKILIHGKNGAGKTTMLNQIYEQIMQKNNPFLVVGYLKQTMSDANLELTVRAYIAQNAQNEFGNIRTLLSKFKYSENTYFKKISELSEGEKMQLNLSLMINRKTNILIMDEPTNYLDVRSIVLIEQALKRYLGTIILVTHDFVFADNINVNKKILI